MTLEIGVLIGLLGLIFTVGGYVVSLEKRLTALETTTKPFISALEQMALSALHKPHSDPQTLRLDALIDRRKAGTLQKSEAYQLRELLQEKIKGGDVPDFERMAALIVCAALTTDYRLDD